MSSPKASPAPAKVARKRAAPSKASKPTGTYVDQVVKAIQHYAIRGGVSSSKIKAYIEDNADHPIQKGALNRAIKKAVDNGIITAKAGHANTFHLTSKAKKSPASAAKSPSAKKTGVAAKKAKASPARKATSSKKKAAAASPAASPKSPKSPSAKKSPSTKKAAPKRKAASTKKAAAPKKAKAASTKKAPAKKASSSKKKAAAKK